MRAVERVALAGALAILIGGAFFTPQLVLREDNVSESVVTARTTRDESDETRAVKQARGEREPGEAGNGFTDLYGNEISDAIATYTFDRSGSLYELHSPQTALPRLGSPKS